MPDLRIDYRPVETLIPYAKNARTHSPEQIEQIAASIREFSWTNPILIDPDGGIIAGHGRLMAAQKLGMADVPCIVIAGLTEAQRRALVIADNRLAENAGWDLDLLRSEIGALQDADFDVSLLGWDDDALAEIMVQGTEGLTDPDAAPPAPKEPVTRPGDLWILGAHRIVCGDSTDAAVVQRVLDGVQPHLMVTDPPYGVNYDASWREKAGLTGEGSAQGKVQNDDRADWREAWALFPGTVAYIWHGALHALTVAESLDAARFKVRAQIVWVKTRGVISRGHYHWQHEPAFYAEKQDPADGSFSIDHDGLTYAVRPGKAANWRGGRKQTTVWFIEHLKSETGHSTQKPVECMRRPIENNSSPGQAVYEPFSGSGTTIIAAETTGRACHAVELDPAYVDVAVLRWQAFTGQKAVLDGDGRTFDEVAAARPKAEAKA